MREIFSVAARGSATTCMSCGIKVGRRGKYFVSNVSACSAAYTASRTSACAGSSICGCAGAANASFHRRSVTRPFAISICAVSAGGAAEDPLAFGLPAAGTGSDAPGRGGFRSRRKTAHRASPPARHAMMAAAITCVSVMGRPLLFRRAHLGRRALEPFSENLDLHLQGLNLPVLPEYHVAELSHRALQVGYF